MAVQINAIRNRVHWGESVVGATECVLVTGATGFVGTTLVQKLLLNGFQNVRCLARPSSDLRRLETVLHAAPRGARIEIVRGNLLSTTDCGEAARGVSLVYHLAVGAGDKSYASTFLNTVVTTKLLLDACIQVGRLKRFVNVSSFAVYSNRGKSRRAVLDESSAIELRPERQGAYCFAKANQDQVVAEYSKEHGIPCVTIRPGVVYGPGKTGLPGRVGLATFGVFLHLGGSNMIPLTFVDNCADAIILAGTRRGVEGQVFNVVDDDLPSSSCILKMYKRHVKRFASVRVPRLAGYLLFWAWEGYSDWSKGQLPPLYNRAVWHAYWKGSRYCNRKAKAMLGWFPAVDTSTGLRSYLQACKSGNTDA